MRVLLSASVALACVLAPPLAVAQQGQQALSEAEVLKRLSPDSPRVRAIRAEIELARADAAAAARFPNPRVTISREAVAGVAEDFFLVAQPLPITGRRGFEQRAAEALVRAAEFRAGSLERRARAQLRIAFASLVESQTRERQLESTLLRLRDLVDILTKREQAGDAAGYDRLRAEREALDVEVDLALASADRARAQGSVAAFFEPGVDPRTLTVDLSEPPRLSMPTFEELVALAERTRGDLQALAAEVDAAGFARRAAARRSVPEPEVTAGVKTSNFGPGDRGSVISVLAAVPFFDRARPERLRADAQERRASAELEVRRIELRATIAGLVEAIAGGRAALEAYRTTAVSRADELERIARVSYEAGERGILELLDAYRSGAAARVRLAALAADLRRAEAELELVSGWEMMP